MRVLFSLRVLLTLALASLCACGVRTDSSAGEQEQAPPPALQPSPDTPGLALPQDSRRYVLQRTSTMWLKIEGRQSRDDGKRYRLKKIAVQINRGAVAPDHSVKITGIRYRAAEDSNWIKVSPPASGPGAVSAVECPSDIDFSKHYFVETTLFKSDGKASAPANGVHLSFTYLDAMNVPILPIEVG